MGYGDASRDVVNPHSTKSGPANLFTTQQYARGIEGCEPFIGIGGIDVQYVGVVYIRPEEI